MRGSSSVWLEHLFVEQGVGGSSPPYRTPKRSQECLNKMNKEKKIKATLPSGFKDRSGD